MLKTSDALREILSAQPFLDFGFRKGIFNLTKLAHFVLPLVEERVKKTVTPQSVLVALTRISQQKTDLEERFSKITLDAIGLKSGVCVATFVHDPSIQRAFSKILIAAQNEGRLCVFSEGAREITIAIDSALIFLLEPFSALERVRFPDATAITLSFSMGMLRRPGVLAAFLETLAMQGISLIEVISTSTEITIFVEKTNAELAFSTLHRAFG